MAPSVISFAPNFAICADGSPFASFLRLSDWLFARAGGRSHGIALQHLAEMLFEFLTGPGGREPADVAAAIWRDYQRGGRSDVPVFLRPYVSDAAGRGERRPRSAAPRRQARHLG